MILLGKNHGGVGRVENHGAMNAKFLKPQNHAVNLPVYQNKNYPTTKCRN
jgi:hypothetical protein